jgi:hypothetical protein
MLKTILFLSNLALLLSKYYILNIEQGDDKVSEFIDAMTPFKWETTGMVSSGTHNLPAEKDKDIALFDGSLKALDSDVLPNISISKTSDDKKKFSYDLKKCDTCLSFNYIDQAATKDSNVDCTLTFPGKEFKTLEKTDQHDFEKVLNFGSFNIALKNGKIYFAKHDGEKFRNFVDLSEKLSEFSEKVFLDIMAFERSPNFIFILCHTDKEIFAFKINSDDKYEFNIVHTVNKKVTGLTYPILSFGANSKSLIIVFKQAEFSFVIITNPEKGKPEIEEKTILENGKPIDIHDAKFSTATGHIFIIVKGKGLYSYNIKDNELYSIVHPHLTQIDMISKAQDKDFEFIGVYVDQTQKDVKEVLIEFLFVPDQKKLYLNKVFTSNGLKFQTDFTASKNAYGLYTKDALYLLPARSPNRIFTFGTKVEAKDIATVEVVESSVKNAYVLNGRTNPKLLAEKDREARGFTCKFAEEEKYTVDWLSFSVGPAKGVSDSHDVYNLDVGGKEVYGLSVGVILLIVAVIIVVIGVGVACYIRKRNAIQRARGGQLL